MNGIKEPSWNPFGEPLGTSEAVSKRAHPSKPPCSRSPLSKRAPSTWTRAAYSVRRKPLISRTLKLAKAIWKDRKIQDCSKMQADVGGLVGLQLSMRLAFNHLDPFHSKVGFAPPPMLSALINKAAHKHRPLQPGSTPCRQCEEPPPPAKQRRRVHGSVLECALPETSGIALRPPAPHHGKSVPASTEYMNTKGRRKIAVSSREVLHAVRARQWRYIQRQ